MVPSMGGARLLPSIVPSYATRSFADLLQELTLRNPKRVEALKPLLVYALQEEDERDRARFFQFFRLKATGKHL